MKFDSSVTCAALHEYIELLQRSLFFSASVGFTPFKKNMLGAEKERSCVPDGSCIEGPITTGYLDSFSPSKMVGALSPLKAVLLPYCEPYSTNGKPLACEGGGGGMGIGFKGIPLAVAA